METLERDLYYSSLDAINIWVDGTLVQAGDWQEPPIWLPPAPQVVEEEATAAPDQMLKPYYDKEWRGLLSALD